jgi:hypothetical protein
MAMRLLSTIAAIAAGFAATACTYVERERPPPAPVVLQQPAAPAVVQTPPPTVTVRPSY